MWETQRIDLSGTAQSSGLHIRTPWSAHQYCAFSVPRFIGRTAEEAFQLDQVLGWSQDPENPGRVHFALTGDPGATGVEFHGDVTLAEPDEAHISLSMTNCMEQELKSGRHLIFLDFSALPEFVDPSGANTFYYTDAGWRSRADLFRDAGITDPSFTVRVGSHVGRTTVIWDLVARMDGERKHLVAFSLNRAFAFSSDHPDWGTGLVAACRWSRLAPGERHYAMGIVYLLAADLQQLEDRYIRNRKRR
jgi:hypothetical protein